MARTQVKAQNILDHSLTGASFRSELQIYDETANYSVDDEVLWQSAVYKALVSITGGIEGDLSHAPDISPYWEIKQGILFAVYPDTIQTFDNNRITVLYNQIRYNNPACSLDTNTGTITIGEDGVYIIGVTQTNEDQPGSNDRSTSYTFLQIDKNDGNGFQDVPNWKIAGYHRMEADGETTGYSSMPIELNQNDKIRIQTVEKDTADGCQTVPDGCNLIMWAPQGSRGPKGEKGDKGDPGSGTTMVVQDEGTSIPNSPHSTLNFKGDSVTVTDAGSGVAEINVIPKYEFIQTVWAEENAGLNANSYEWAFGNGANTPLHYGCPIYVPSGYTAEVVALGLIVSSDDQTVNATVQCEVTDSSNNMNSVGSVTADYGGTGVNRAISELSTPYSIGNAYSVNFKTTSVSGSSKGPNVATAYIKFKEI
jgi:hypothetical protein